MRVADLIVERSPAGLELRFLGGAPPELSGALVADLRPWAESFMERLKQAETLGPEQALKSFVRPNATELADALPRAILSGITDWASQPGAEPTLIVHEDGWLPWELLAALVPTLLVARVAREPTTQARTWPAVTGPARLLAAGWTTIFDNKPLPGIQRELAELGQRISDSGLELTTSTNPTFAELTEAIGRNHPHLLHLSPPAIDDQSQRLPMGSDAAAVEWIPVAALVTELLQEKALRLVTLNTCHGGYEPCRTLCESLGVATIGWAGGVEDQLATELSFSLYPSLLEGLTIPEAVRRFCRQFGADRMLARGMPVVWGVSRAQLEAPLFESAAAERPTPPGVRPAAGTGRRKVASPARAQAHVALERSAGPPRIDIELKMQSTLFPSLIRNGVPAIKVLRLNVDREAEVELEIECDTGAGCSAHRETVKVENRLAYDLVTEVQFPALYQLMESEGRRYVSFSVTVRHAGQVVARKTDSVLWRGRSEWLDLEEAWPYLASFVVPMSPGVLRVVEEARRVLRAIGGPKATFSGYVGGYRETDRQVDAVFQALRDPPLSIRYIAPPGFPIFTGAPAGSVASPAPMSLFKAERRPETRQVGQLVRLPDAVVQQRQGTCHDLSLLFAAVLEYLNLYPLLILIEGHTFFGYWRSEEAYAEFWESKLRVRSRPRKGPDRILGRKEVEDQLGKGRIRLVEATRVSEPETFEEACEMGNMIFGQTAETNAEGLRKWDAAIDVAASRKQLVEPI